MSKCSMAKKIESLTQNEAAGNSVSNFSRDSLGVSFDGKFGTMRKPADWVIYPTKPEDKTFDIQCDNRWATIEKETGKMLLSAPHSFANSWVLANDVRTGKAQRITLEPEVLKQLLDAIGDRRITDHSLDNIIRSADVTDAEIRGESLDKKNEDAGIKVGDFVSYDIDSDGKDLGANWIVAEVLAVNDDGTLKLQPHDFDVYDDIPDASASCCSKLDHFAGFKDAHHYYMDGRINVYKGGWEILFTEKELDPKVFEFIGTIDDISEADEVDAYYQDNTSYDIDLKDEIERTTAWATDAMTFADLSTGLARPVGGSDNDESKKSENVFYRGEPLRKVQTAMDKLMKQHGFKFERELRIGDRLFNKGGKKFSYHLVGQSGDPKYFDYVIVTKGELGWDRNVEREHFDSIETAVDWLDGVAESKQSEVKDNEIPYVMMQYYVPDEKVWEPILVEINSDDTGWFYDGLALMDYLGNFGYDEFSWDFIHQRCKRGTDKCDPELVQSMEKFYLKDFTPDDEYQPRKVDRLGNHIPKGKTYIGNN